MEEKRVINQKEILCRLRIEVRPMKALAIRNWAGLQLIKLASLLMLGHAEIDVKVGKEK